MSNSVWVNKLHSQLPLNLQEERVKDVLIGFRLRHEVHRVFSIGNRSLVVDFYPYLIIKRTTAEKMLEYFDYIDKNSIRGRNKIPSDYYENLDSIYWTIK